MRLIVERGFAQPAVEGSHRRWEDFTRDLRCITSLEEFEYPPGGTYCDVLWMVDTEERFKHLKQIMASRFKKCTADPDEFAQAGWTRAMFDQVDSLVWMCRQGREWVEMPGLSHEEETSDHRVGDASESGSEDGDSDKEQAADGNPSDAE